MSESFFAETTTDAEWPDDGADLTRRHRESLFPSVGLFYDEPIELRQGERQFVYDGAGREYLESQAGKHCGTAS